MDFLNALNISGSGLTAQKLRMDLMSQNIASSDVTRTQAGGPYRRKMAVFTSVDESGFLRELMKASYGDSGTRSDRMGDVKAPAYNKQEYGRFNADFRHVGSYLLNRSDRTANAGGVMVARIIEDQSDFIPVYDPTHPDANEEGYVFLPNVNRTQEIIDMLGATRAYSANVTVFNATKAMISTALQIGR